MAILKDLTVLGPTVINSTANATELFENGVSLKDKYLQSADVGNGVLTVQTGATPSLGSFSANQSGNTTITLQQVALTGKIGDLSDVTSAGTSDGKVLIYDNYSSNWKPSSPPWIIEECVHSAVTYSDLYAAYSNKTLQPNCLYRIIDFCTTTKSSNKYRSAGNTFQVVVRAVTNETLDCMARVFVETKINTDYFMDTDWSKWIIWYDIENDTDKYEWADTVGTGVIYRMIDEYGNDCPYDFKNIQFKRTLYEGTVYLKDADFKPTDSWCYTFDLTFKENSYDVSVDTSKPAEGIDDFKGNVTGNVIKPIYAGTKQLLNDNVFFSNDPNFIMNGNITASPEYYNNYIGYGSSGITCVGKCESIKIGNKCSYIDILNNSSCIDIGDNVSTIYLPPHSTNFIINDGCYGILIKYQTSTEVYNDFGKYAFMRNFVFEPGCSHIYILDTPSTGSNGSWVQNVYVANGVDTKDIDIARNLSYRTTYSYQKDYCEDAEIPVFNPSTDEGKVLQIVNGVLTWVSPVTVYTGNGQPSASLGNNNDIYLQE